MKPGLHAVGMVLLICLAGSPSKAEGRAVFSGWNQEPEFLANQPLKKEVPAPAKNPEGIAPCAAQTPPSLIDSKVVFETGDTPCSKSRLEATETANLTRDSDYQPKAGHLPFLVTGWERHRPFLRQSKGGFEVFLNGYLQLDWRNQGYTPNKSVFLARRARLGVDGKFHRNVDFKIQFDFSNPRLVGLRDAYVKLRLPHGLLLTVGHLKTPLGQEELHSDSALEFVERSLMTNLTAHRSPGITLSGEMGKGRFEYELGIFNGDGKFQRAGDRSPEGVFRLRFSPWKNSSESRFKGLAFGGAFARSLADRRGESYRGRAEGQHFVFFKPRLINGKATRANVEMSWLVGPASFRTEYDQTNQAREGVGSPQTNLPGVIARGYMAQFTYLLTGETKPDSKNVVPRRGFMDKENGLRGFGAWELKLRYANLQINDSTDRSNRADSLYFGLNWYLNQHVRYMLDIGHERFKDPLRQPNGSRVVILSRIQLSF